MSEKAISTQLLLTISEENLYPKLITQLNRDFNLAGIDEEFYLNIKPETLLNYLNTIVYNLRNHNYPDYLNLLYRVDVSEIQLKQIENTDLEQMSNQVSLLILKRECQKVLIRNKL